MELSHAKRVLAAIQAVIEGRATKDQESYTIAGRSLARTPIPDLLLLMNTYQRKVDQEDRETNFNKRRAHVVRVRI